MRIHLVFDSATSAPLSESLQSRGYEVAGGDATLEQFALAAESGQISADLAIVDGTAGIVQKQDSVTLLRMVRGFIPDTRLIVILPLEADQAWIAAIGALGIYDIYSVDQFMADDVESWIRAKKTILDIERLQQTHEVEGRVPKGTGARRLVVELKKRLKEPREEIRSVTVGCGVVAVGGLHKRSGTTHTAIQLAVLLMRSGLKTALLEYRAADNHESDLVWIKPDDAGETSFEMDGIEFYPACKSIGEVISRGHDAVVIDAGTLDEPAALDEWRRAAVRIITISAAPWDVGRAKLSEFAADQAAIVVNYATQGMYETIYELLKHHEKPIVHNRGGYDPFSPDLSLVPIVSTLLPEKRRRKVF